MERHKGLWLRLEPEVDQIRVKERQGKIGDSVRAGGEYNKSYVVCWDIVG